MDSKIGQLPKEETFRDRESIKSYLQLDIGGTWFGFYRDTPVSNSLDEFYFYFVELIC